MGFGKDGKGVIIAETKSTALLTLAAGSGLFIGTPLVTLERFRMLKAELTVMIANVTGDEALGLVVYLVDGDLTLAQAESAIETQGPLGPNDIDLTEQAMRPVFRVNDHFGMSGADNFAAGAIGNAVMVVSINPRWTFARTKAWNWMIYNNASALTTGSTAIFANKLFGVWVT